jgi:hypothetical protein
MASLFAVGMVSMGSTVSAPSIQVPVRASVQAPYVAHAITVAKKKKKAKRKATAATGAYPLACTARTAAAAGHWTTAEHQYLAAEKAASRTGNLSATEAFEKLVLNAYEIAMDQPPTGSSTTAVKQTYQANLTKYASCFRGCS